jgi:hypothetical protein
MRNRSSLSTAIIALLLTSACRGEEQGSATNLNSEASSAPANIADAPNPVGNEMQATQGPLSKYVGSHPSTPVEGARFLDEASVRKAVAANVTDAEVRKFVFEYNGPDAPIVAKAGRILAWGCERHNCGYHNWSIAITPDGTSAEVCYYRDNDRPDGTSTWYLPGGTKEQRPGNCPSD